MTEDQISDAAQAKLQAAASELGEEFDSVVILAERNCAGQTEPFRAGTGSYFAQLGLLHKAIDDHQNIALAREIALLLEEE